MTARNKRGTKTMSLVWRGTRVKPSLVLASKKDAMPSKIDAMPSELKFWYYLPPSPSKRIEAAFVLPYNLL